MDMTFPNLPGETPGFPADDVRVYEQYRNTFDYHRWTADTRMTLCAVPWDGTSNVVQWDSDAARDGWFAQTDGYRDTLQTEMRILPDGSLKVPLPFDASGLYNYVWVQFPVATSGTAPLDHETATGVREWGFFVDSMEYRSPSCTELRLSVDWWTTFSNRVTVNAMQLARGHYAMAQAASVDEYLAEPLAHTGWLQGMEPEAVAERVNRLVATVDASDGGACVVLDFGGCDPSGSWDAQVPGLAAHYRDVTGTLAGCMVAVAASDMPTLGTSAPIGLWQCVRAAYLCPTKWLALGSAVTIGSVTAHIVEGGTTIATDVHLTREDFGYPSEYADVTKLYTSPYALVHIVDDSGRNVTIAPETLGATQRVDMASQTTAAGIRIMSVLQGVGSSELATLDLSTLDSRSMVACGDWQRTLMEWDVPTFAVYQSNQELTAWTKAYERQQARDNATTAYSNATASAETSLSNANASADTAYTNTLQSNIARHDNTSATIATTLQNALDANLTAYTNAKATNDVIHENATATSLVVHTNANVTNDTAYDNAVATSLVTHTNANSTNQCNYDNTDANATLTTTTAANSANNITANNAATVAANNANVAANVNAANQGATASTNKLTLDVTSDLNASYAGLLADQAVVGVTMSNNDARAQAASFSNGMTALGSAATGVGELVVGVAEAAVTGGAMGGGTAVSAIGGLVSTVTGYFAQSNQIATDWQTANASALVTASNNTTLYQAGVQNATEKGAHANTYTTTATSISNTAKNTINSNNNTALNTQANNNANLANSNAASTAATMRANALRSRDTSNVNADRVYDRTNANALATRDAANTNADRTYDRTNANADAVQTTANANASRTMGTADANAERTRTTGNENNVRTKDTADANAERTHDTALANAQRTRDNALANAQRTRDNALAAVENGIRTDDVQAPHAFGRIGDVGSKAMRPMCVQVRVERGTDGDVARCGDAMLRYGYSCDRSVRDFQGFNVMPHFTYWQASEVWLTTDGRAPEGACDAIRGILTEGVTVWRDPDEVGRVSIYGNR